MNEISEIAEENDLFVIKDATRTIDAKYKGKKIGNISELTIFSFHPVKNNDDLYE